jgi:hypothetical protein
MWNADPLLGNDLEIGSYTIAVAKTWPSKLRLLLGNDHNRHGQNNIKFVGSSVLCAVSAEAI